MNFGWMKRDKEIVSTFDYIQELNKSTPAGGERRCSQGTATSCEGQWTPRSDPPDEPGLLAALHGEDTGHV